MGSRYLAVKVGVDTSACYLTFEVMIGNEKPGLDRIIELQTYFCEIDYLYISY